MVHPHTLSTVIFDFPPTTFFPSNKPPLNQAPPAHATTPLRILYLALQQRCGKRRDSIGRTRRLAVVRRHFPGRRVHGTSLELRRLFAVRIEIPLVSRPNKVSLGGEGRCSTLEISVVISTGDVPGVRLPRRVCTGRMEAPLRVRTSQQRVVHVEGLRFKSHGPGFLLVVFLFVVGLCFWRVESLDRRQERAPGLFRTPAPPPVCMGQGTLGGVSAHVFA